MNEPIKLMASGSIKMNDFLIKQFNTPNITYTANTETNGSYDFTSVIPSGYQAVGVLGYNTGVPKANVRRLYIEDANPNIVLYSITSPSNLSMGLIITLLLKKI